MNDKEKTKEKKHLRISSHLAVRTHSSRSSFCLNAFEQVVGDVKYNYWLHVFTPIAHMVHELSLDASYGSVFFELGLCET